jgi:hypothetical protein
MNKKAYNHKRKSAKRARPPLERPIVEVRQITIAIYGVRVAPGFVDRVSRVPGLRRAKPDSDMFCVEVAGLERSEEGALRMFREAVAAAGLGRLFGVAKERS